MIPTIAALLLFPVQAGVAGDETVDRAEWAVVFEELEAEGTMVVVDERERSKGAFVFDRKRDEKRFSPASTFKIPHALIALDAGVIRDEFQVIPWDGKK